MKIPYFPAIAAAIVITGITACNNGTGTTDTDSTLGTSMGDSVSSNMENAASSVKGDLTNNENDDSSFVVKAMASNTEELILIQTGIDKGTNSQLKANARKMLADHNKLKTQLKSYTDKKSYSEPAGDQGKSSDDLADLNKNKMGADWDKAWADLMEKEHKDDIDAFEKGQRNVKDSSLNTLVSNTLPVLRSHLIMAQDLQKIFKK